MVRHRKQLLRDLKLGRRLARVVEGEEEGLVRGDVLALAVGAGPGDVGVASSNTT